MDLMQLLSTLRARIGLILLVIIVTVATAAAISFVLPKQYTSQTDLIIDAKSIDPVSGAALPVQMMSGYLATQVDVIRSHAVALKVVSTLKMDANPSAVEQFNEATKGVGNVSDWLADSLLLSLEVTPSRESSVLAVSFTGADPEFAALIANAFAQAYISTALDLTVEPAKNNSRWFNDQLQMARENLANAQETLANYQREKGIVSTDERLDLENARLNELSAQMVSAQTENMAIQSRTKGKNPEDLPEVINNPVVQRLKADVGLQEAKVSEMSTKLGENNPAYINAKDELKVLKKRLNAEITAVLDSVRSNAAAAQQREDAMRRAVEKQKNHILDLKKQSNSITVLASEVQNAQKAYDFAMQRYSQANMQSQIGQTNIVVLNSARPDYIPSSPKIIINILLSLIMGTMLALGTALLIEMVDRVVRSPADLRHGLDLTVLGVLGREKRARR